MCLRPAQLQLASCSEDLDLALYHCHLGTPNNLPLHLYFASEIQQNNETHT